MAIESLFLMTYIRSCEMTSSFSDLTMLDPHLQKCEYSKIMILSSKSLRQTRLSNQLLYFPNFLRAFKS
jgi:hypothetical protein